MKPLKTIAHTLPTPNLRRAGMVALRQIAAAQAAIPAAYRAFWRGATVDPATDHQRVQALNSAILVAENQIRDAREVISGLATAAYYWQMQFRK